MSHRNKIYGDAIALHAHLKNLSPCKMAFSNGVFDVLHPGHIDVLEFARSCGDLLVVGVNSDDSVKRLAKQGDRPIFPLAERMEVLAALACVDYVVPFSQDTPLELIQILSTITVLVKGGDYKVEDMIGREVVTERGGEVRLYGLTPGYSTTRILSKIWAER